MIGGRGPEKKKKGRIFSSRNLWPPRSTTSVVSSRLTSMTTFVISFPMSSEKASFLCPLSPAEQALMDLIWQKQPVSVGELLRAVNDGRAESITRSTLQTQLHRLETKGWLLSDDEGRARLYRSAPSEKGGRGKCSRS